MPSNPYQSPDAPAQNRSREPLRILLVIVGVLIFLILLVPATLVLGILIWASAEGRARHQQFVEEQAVIEPILASDDAYKDLEVSETSIGYAEISGTVEQEDDIDRLHKILAENFRESRSDQLSRLIHTREQQKRLEEEVLQMKRGR
jgi:hypothetical protein